MAGKHHLVVVEDDPHLRRDLVDFLALRGFEVVGCESAEDFLRLPKRASAELVLLDIGLPGRDGLDLLVELKRKPSCPLVVVLTAYGTDADHVRGLGAGADAYVVKSRSLEVIEATCRSVLRRAGGGAEEAAAWSLDETSAHVCVPGGARIELTHQEAVFLRRTLRAAGQVVTRASLLSELGKTDTLGNRRNLDNLAARLRRKILAETGLELPLRSAYGEGYAFRAEVSDTPSTERTRRGQS